MWVWWLAASVCSEETVLRRVSVCTAYAVMQIPPRENCEVDLVAAHS